MHPYIIEELCRYRRHKIDEDLTLIHLRREIRVKRPKKDSEGLRSLLALLAATGRKVKRSLC